MLNFHMPQKFPPRSLCTLVMREGLVLTLMSCLPYIEKGKIGRVQTDNFESGKVDKFKVGWFALCTNILCYFH